MIYLYYKIFHNIGQLYSAFSLYVCGFPAGYSANDLMKRERIPPEMSSSFLWYTIPFIG